MSVSGTLNRSIVATNSGTVAFEKSVAHVFGDFKGSVSLQTAPVGTTNWVTVLTFNESKSIPIQTPDTTMIFRFFGNLTNGEANVYLGS